MNVFTRGGNNLQLTSSTTSGSIDGVGDVLRIVNVSTDDDAYVVAGVGSQSASNADALIRPGQELFLRIGFVAMRGSAS